MIGDAVAQAFADLLGTTAAEGGYFAGALFTAALFLAFVIISSKLGGGAIPSFGGLVLGAIISWMLGWWPPVSIIVTALLLAAVVVGPFRESSGSQGV